MRGAYLICDYPLRALRPGATALRLLAHCAEEHTCAELAALLNLPVKRVETLCKQLYWKGLLDAGPQLPPETWPGVSIIIPTYNRALQLERCLSSLLQVDYPPACLEIIVVDDASSDETGATLERFVEKCKTKGIPLRIVRHTGRRGVAISRNSGAEQARMEVLAFIDSDCVATSAWLKELTPALQDQSTGAVGGMIRARERRSTLGKYEDTRSSLFKGARPQQVRLEGPLTYLPTSNLLIRRSEWQKLGGFALLTHGEDVDFCHRLLLSGSAVRYEPRGIVLHDYRTGIKGFSKTRISYASSEAVLLQHHPTERRVLLLPPEQATFAALLIGGLWRLAWSWIDGNRNKQSLFRFILAALLILFSARKRLAAVRRQRIPINPFTILRATLRGHLAYVYHLCRHLTRYYTLPMLIAGIIFPPLLLLSLILCTIVIGVDYTRLRPRMAFGRFALCSLLDDCAYEIGVALGCIKQRTWKPLLPVIKCRDQHALRVFDLQALMHKPLGGRAAAVTDAILPAAAARAAAHVAIKSE
ncbi:MAG TPA: mycofactocin biosynthesis glycosyltransferase MftF [Ktedonobacteraceae bacterium]|nr:mycofactocin biosynthesis glycosyltransferase MftF [Ktedonobacteraceae bacterium]